MELSVEVEGEEGGDTDAGHDHQPHLQEETQVEKGFEEPEEKASRLWAETHHRDIPSNGFSTADRNAGPRSGSTDGDDLRWMVGASLLSAAVGMEYLVTTDDPLGRTGE